MPTLVERVPFHEDMAEYHGGSLPPIDNGLDDSLPPIRKNGYVNGHTGPGDGRARNKYLQEFFNTEPCLYSHTIFGLAAQVYTALRRDEEEAALLRRRPQDTTTNMPSIEFDDENQARLTYSLAFATLKYQKLLETILDDIAFFASYPEFREDRSLAAVILADFLQRKFQRRKPDLDEILDETCTEIERALYQNRTKLNAAVARTRIKSQAQSLEYLLPEKLRIKEQAHKCDTVVYAWVNQFNTTLDAVVDDLMQEGFRQVQHTQTDMLQGMQFHVDVHCSDMVVLPAEYRQWLLDHMLVTQGHLIVQDKSSCLGPQSVKALLDDSDDIIHVNLGSGLTTAHLASLVSNTNASVFAFGIQSDKHYEQVKTRLDQLGIRGVRIIQDSFTDVSPDDPRFKSVKAVLVSADCSKSGVPDPVEFIVSEGEGAGILQDLAGGELEQGKLAALVAKHLQVLKHAFRFSRVQAVVYCTRSMYEAENENIVTKAIDQYNGISSKNHHRFPFRLTPPVLPILDRDIERDIVHGKYLKFPPAAGMSGCFVAVITRELEDPKEAAKDILARAAAKGLLGSKPEKKATRLEKAKSDSHPPDQNGDSKQKRKRVKKGKGAKGASSSVQEEKEEKIDVVICVVSAVEQCVVDLFYLHKLYLNLNMQQKISRLRLRNCAQTCYAYGHYNNRSVLS